MIHENFIERNAGTEVGDIPTWYELSEHWSIDARDLKYLVMGPLVQGSTVLVSAYPEGGLGATAWEVVGKVSSIGGVIAFVVWLIEIFS